jgi:hypothetical protein
MRRRERSRCRLWSRRGPSSSIRCEIPVTGRELDPAEKPHLFIDTAWAFHLDQTAARRTRLLARTRIRIEPRWAIVPLRWMGSGDTVMQRRLLDGIKRRVEATAGGPAG